MLETANNFGCDARRDTSEGLRAYQVRHQMGHVGVIVQNHEMLVLGVFVQPRLDYVWKQ